MPRCLKKDTPDGQKGCTCEVHHRGKCRIREHPTGEYANRSAQAPRANTPATGPKPVGVIDMVARKASRLVLVEFARSMAKAAGLTVVEAPPRT